MTLSIILQSATAADSGFSWNGIWTVAVAVVTGVISLLSLRKSGKAEKVSDSLDVRKFEAEEKERALANAVEECDRCREQLAAERERSKEEHAAAIAQLRTAEERLGEALRQANDAWVLVGTYRERERVWLIERAEFIAKLERTDPS